MNRVGWLALSLVLLLGAGWVWLGRRASDSASVDRCLPSDLRAFERDGYVHVACPDAGAQGAGAPLTASAKWTLGLKVKLNAVSEEELARLPGVGLSLAKSLVEARTARGGFRSWDEVDEVAGVGPAKLKELRSVLEL